MASAPAVAAESFLARAQDRTPSRAEPRSGVSGGPGRYKASRLAAIRLAQGATPRCGTRIRPVGEHR